MSAPTSERLAPGAPPPAGFTPLCVPELRGNEWEYVKECLDTNWVSSVGSYVDRFERSLAQAAGTRHAIATTSGTAALHVALMLAGVERDDEVLVSTLTFIAPANAIRYVGAWPVFVDAEPEYWQMDTAKAIDFLERGCEWKGGVLRNRVTGRRVRAVMPVHILGHPVDMRPLVNAARKYGLCIIEDATESLGATYHGTPTGHLGDMACFSFNGNKIITTGGGGMLVTDDEALAKRARYLTTQAKDDPVEYEHHEVGYNYRLTNVLAAMGVAQMEQLPSYVDAKRRIAATYSAALGDVPGFTPMREAPWARSTFWMYTTLVDPAIVGSDARALLRALGAAQIQSRPLWQPMHQSAAHTGAFATDCSTAEFLHARALSLPCSVGLAPDAQALVIDHLLHAASHAAA